MRWKRAVEPCEDRTMIKLQFRRLAFTLPGLISLFPCGANAAGQFRAGAHAVDISPKTVPIVTSGQFLPLVAERSLDPLHARSLALDDGQQRLVIMVVDTLMMPRELLDRVKGTASRSTGVPTQNMMISATHTHSAPAVMGALGTDVNTQYVPFFEVQLVKAIEGAVRHLAPARAGWTVVQDFDHTHNRRWILRPDRMRQDPFGEWFRSWNGMRTANHGSAVGRELVAARRSNTTISPFPMAPGGEGIRFGLDG